MPEILSYPYSGFWSYVRENAVPLDHAMDVALNTLAAHGLAGTFFDELKRIEDIAKGVAQELEGRAA